MKWQLQNNDDDNNNIYLGHNNHSHPKRDQQQYVSVLPYMFSNPKTCETSDWGLAVNHTWV